MHPANLLDRLAGRARAGRRLISFHPTICSPQNIGLKTQKILDLLLGHRGQLWRARTKESAVDPACSAPHPTGGRAHGRAPSYPYTRPTLAKVLDKGPKIIFESLSHLMSQSALEEQGSRRSLQYLKGPEGFGILKDNPHAPGRCLRCAHVGLRLLERFKDVFGPSRGPRGGGAFHARPASAFDCRARAPRMPGMALSTSSTRLISIFLIFGPRRAP